MRLAEEGTAITALDICAPVASVSYDMASLDDLRQTAELVEQHGAAVHPAVVDVRDYVSLEKEITAGVEALEGLDIVVSNAGIASYAAGHEVSDRRGRR